MELSSIPNRVKKKDSESADFNRSFVVKPEFFDGQTNWLRLKESIGVTKKAESNSEHQRFSNSHIFKRKAREVPEKSSSSQFKFSFSEKGNTSHKKDTDFYKKKSIGNSKMSSKKAGELNEHGLEYVEGRRLTKSVAMDCEMVGTGPDGNDSVLARVSIVNSYGECIYDEFVKPKEKVTDFRTAVSGVRPSDLKKGKNLFDVQKDVSDIIKDRRVIGHALKHDFEVLFISHPNYHTRDTSRYKPFRDLSGGRTPSLKKLASMVLGCNIQDGEHSSVEDAQAAMLLYLNKKKEWEKDIRSKRRKPAKK